MKATMVLDERGHGRMWLMGYSIILTCASKNKITMDAFMGVGASHVVQMTMK
jgi:uncharacterized membrane protein